MGRPGHGQRMHTVFGLKNVRRVKAVLTTRSWHDAIVGAVMLAMFVAQLPQHLLALSPVDSIVLAFRKPAGVANPIFAKVDRRLLRILGVLVFNSGIRALI